MNCVSVIVPVYNGEATVARSIEGALDQRFDGAAEVVVVNDGSTDSTADILKGFSPPIKVVEKSNGGPAAARNAGVAASSGEYLAFLDADDVWSSHYLSSLCATLEKNPGASMAFCDLLGIDHEGNPVHVPAAGHAPTMEDLLSRGCPIYPSAVVMHRKAFELCGGFCEQFRAPGGEDPYMWLRAREVGAFEYVPERLVTYRVPSFVDRAEKYADGARILVRLVRERYGRSARGLIDIVNSEFAAGLAQKALLQVDSGNFKGALRTWVRVLRIKPSYFLDPNIAPRFFRPRNLARLIGILSPSRSRA